MSRIKAHLAVAAVLTFGLVGGGAWADPGNGNGYDNAREHCQATIDRQNDDGIRAGGGFKDADAAPANCDHAWSH